MRYTVFQSKKANQKIKKEHWHESATIVRSTYGNQDYSGSSPRVSTDGKTNRLGQVDRDCDGSPQKKRHQNIRTSAGIPSVAWCSGFNGSKKYRLPSGPRLDNLLCASPVSVQFNGIGLESGSCNDIRIYSNAWKIRNGKNQCAYTKGSRDIEIGKSQIANERHDSARGDDSLSQRSGTDVAICANRREGSKVCRKEIYRCEGEDKKSERQSEGAGAMFAFVCKNKRSEEESGQEIISHSDRDPESVRRSARGDEEGEKQITGRAETVAWDNEYVTSPDKAFYQDGVCGKQKNNSFEDDRVVFNYAWETGEKCGVWNQVGSESDSRWIYQWFFNRWRQTRIGYSILHGGITSSQGIAWKSTEGIRVRSRWLQYDEYKEGETNGSQACRYCSQREGPLECIGEATRKNKKEKGHNRRMHWSDQKEIWLQQAQCSLNGSDDTKRISRIYRIQHDEVGKIGNGKTSGVEIRMIMTPILAPEVAPNQK